MASFSDLYEPYLKQAQANNNATAWNALVGMYQGNGIPLPAWAQSVDPSKFGTPQAASPEGAAYIPTPQVSAGYFDPQQAQQLADQTAQGQDQRIADRQAAQQDYLTRQQAQQQQGQQRTPTPGMPAPGTNPFRYGGSDPQLQVPTNPRPSEPLTPIPGLSPTGNNSTPGGIAGIPRGGRGQAPSTGDGSSGTLIGRTQNPSLTRPGGIPAGQQPPSMIDPTGGGPATGGTVPPPGTTPPPQQQIPGSPRVNPPNPPPRGGGDPAGQAPIPAGLNPPSPGGGSNPTPGGGTTPTPQYRFPPTSGRGGGGGGSLPSFGDGWTPPQFNPNGGGFPGDNGQINPVYYGYQIGAAGDPSLSYIPDLTTNDPNRIYRNAQNVSYNLGAGIDADLTQQYGQQQGLYAGFGNAANSAYGDLARTPGYTTDEQANIVRDPQYQAAMTTADQYASLGPTSAETSGMTGNTASYGDYFDPSKLSMSSDYTAGLNNAVSGTRSGLSGAESAASYGLKQALGDSGLYATPDYARQAGMSDAEVDQMANAAARNVGLQASAQKYNIMRQAAASGNASPLAVAAAMDRANQTGEVNAADAVVNARIAARQAQQQAAQNVQATQLGAAQYRAGQGANAAQYMGNLQSSNALAAGQMAQNAANQQEQTRMAGEQAVTNTGTAIRQAQDAANVSRAANLYGIRQGNTQYQQQSQYQQGMGVNNALSQGYQNTAQARMAGQQQYRNYLTGQQGQALGASQTAQQQRTSNYGTMTGALNANAGQWGNYAIGRAALPSGWQQVAGAFAQANPPNPNP